MADHVRVIAVIRLIYGVLAMLLVAGCGLLAALFSGDHNKFFDTIGFIFAFLALLGAVHGAMNLAAGWGLLSRRSWARLLSIGLAVLELPGFPVGTALGGYSLWVLFDKQVIGLFAAPPPPSLPVAPPPPARLPASDQKPLVWE